MVAARVDERSDLPLMHSPSLSGCTSHCYSDGVRAQVPQQAAGQRGRTSLIGCELKVHFNSDEPASAL